MLFTNDMLEKLGKGALHFDLSQQKKLLWFIYIRIQDWPSLGRIKIRGRLYGGKPQYLMWDYMSKLWHLSYQSQRDGQSPVDG